MPDITGTDTDQGERVADMDALIEAVAADVHAAWIETKRAQGIESRPSADGVEQMVPYGDLPDHIQELDRATVRAVFASPALKAALGDA